MSENDRTGKKGDRQYRTTDLDTLRHFDRSVEDREILITLYEQTCTTWRLLVDVRFKLFALVPTASLFSLAVFFGATDPQKQLHPRLLLAFACFGLLVTLGLSIYDIRNSQLYDDLISRGRKIEDELGVATAVFLGRKNPKWPFVNHTTATWLIYGSAISAWIAGLIWAGARAFPSLVF
jgi:hypothetical protein